MERYNASGTLTGSGTNVSVVQTSTTLGNPAEGDVIKVFNDAPFSPKVDGADSTYSINKFTIQSGDGAVHTVSASNRWYDLHPDNVTRNYDITIANLKCTGYSAGHCNGAFICLNGKNANNTLVITLNNVEVNGFVGNDNSVGGVFHFNRSVTVKGNSADFLNNSSGRGGVINVGGGLTLNIDNVSFIGNKATNGQGGAIYTTENTTITGKTISFSSNTATTHGGGIRVDNANATLTLTGNNITFDGNKASGNDGGAMNAHIIEITGTGTNPVIKFEKNESKNVGGAIVGYTQLTLKTGSFYFDKNKLTNGYTGGRSGGAIETNLLSITDANEVSFTNNVSLYKGGAINLGSGSSCSGTIEAKTILFQNNSASDYGGAINGGTFAFSGSGTTATFTGNTAGQGNDIYLNGTSGTVLSFTNTGTYSFDGGIYLDENTAQTVINQAQVTIAGRQYKPVANEGDPLVEDNTNVYQFQNVTISNGGSLTANLDYIDSLTGTFNVAGATDENKGTLELNVSENAVKKLNADSFKVVRTDLGEVVKTGDGTLQLCNEAQDMIDINGLVVSSGRMDILGYMTGGITIKPDSVFSPGNSVGDARFGGGYELKEDAMLLIEQDASGIDTLTATSFDIDSNSIIDFAADSLQPGASYDIIFQTDSEGNPKNFTGAQATDDFWNNLLTPESAYYWNLTVSGNVVRASVDPNAVPEPSTWALLILGAAGLLYVRKRKN